MTLWRFGIVYTLVFAALLYCFTWVLAFIVGDAPVNIWLVWAFLILVTCVTVAALGRFALKTRFINPVNAVVPGFVRFILHAVLTSIVSLACGVSLIYLGYTTVNEALILLLPITIFCATMVADLVLKPK